MSINQPATTLRLNADVASAQSLHSAGRLLEARNAYQRILFFDPNNANVLHLLGAVHLQERDYAAAKSCIGKAIALLPDQPDFHVNYGLILADEGDMEAARQSTEIALRLNPKHVEANFNLGLFCQKRGDYAGAAEFFKKGGDASHLASNSTRAGFFLLGIGRAVDALALFSKSLKHDTSDLGAVRGIGECYLKIRQYGRAIDAFSTLIEIAPDDFRVLNLRGCAYLESGHFDKALTDFKVAERIQPEDPILNRNIAAVYLRRRRFDLALTHADRGLLASPDDPALNFIKGCVQMEWECYADALSALNKSISADPGNARALWNKGLCLLETGAIEEGLQYYEHRWAALGTKMAHLKTSRRVWMEGDTQLRLFVWSEQGAGDEVFFARALSSISELSTEPTIQVDGRLLSVFKRSFPALNFVPRRKNYPEELYDVHLAMADLFSKTYIGSRSKQALSKSFLRADLSLAAQFRSRFKVDGQALVGITWQSKNADIGENKSLSLDQMLPILCIEGVKFVSLQYGDVQEDIERLFEISGVRIHNVSEIDNFHDMESHMALIEACDFVVTGCNTSAHLAGAIGKAGFVLVPSGQSAFWYWHNSVGGVNLWYPTLRVVRRKPKSDWDSAVDEAAKLIREYIDSDYK